MADNEITLTIDGTSVAVPAGTTILKAAEKLGRPVPTTCSHGNGTANGLGRICGVEVDAVKPRLPAGLSPVSEGMKFSTPSARFGRGLRIILNLLASAVDLPQPPEFK